MRILGNILWHIPFFGFLSAFFSFLIGSLLVLAVVTAPIGLGLIQFSKFQLAPFSYGMVSKNDLSAQQNQLWKSYSFIVKIIYFPFGLLFVLFGALQVFGLCLSIIGIPVAIVIAKSLGTYLQPVGKVCVPVAVAQEIATRKGSKDIEKYLGTTTNHK